MTRAQLGVRDIARAAVGTAWDLALIAACHLDWHHYADGQGPWLDVRACTRCGHRP